MLTLLLSSNFVLVWDTAAFFFLLFQLLLRVLKLISLYLPFLCLSSAYP